MIKKNRLSLIIVLFLIQLTAVSAAGIFVSQDVYELGDTITAIVYSCPDGTYATASVEDYWAATGTINNGQWADFFEIPLNFPDTGMILTLNGYCEEEVSTNFCVNPGCGEVNENEPPEGVEEPPVPPPPEETPEDYSSSGGSSSSSSEKDKTSTAGTFGGAIRGSKVDVEKPKKKIINLISPARPSFEKSTVIDPAPIEVTKDNFYLYSIVASLLLIILVFVFIRWKKHKDDPNSAEIQPTPIHSESQPPIIPVESSKESIPQPIDFPDVTLPAEQTLTPKEEEKPEEDDDWYVRQ